MSAFRKVWRVTWRLVVCGLLLAWIFQSIFWNEGQTAWQNAGNHPAWAELTRFQRLEFSWRYGPRELLHSLSLVQPDVIALSFFLVGVTIFIGTFRWWLVLRAQGIKIPLSRANEISLVATFFNAFLLGSTGGDLMKAYYAAQDSHHKKPEAVVTVFVDRLIGLFAMLLFATLMMLLNLPLILATKTITALSAVVVAMMIGCGLVIYVAFWGGVSKRLPSARQWLRRLPKGAVLEQSLDACRIFGRKPKLLLQCLGLSMFLNLLCVIQAAILSNGLAPLGLGSTGLGLGVSPVALLVIVPMIICISALPITPSGLGVRENLYVFMLGAPMIHVARTSALSLSLMVFAGSLFWSIVGGVVYTAFKEKHHLSEVAESEPASDTQ